MADAAEPVTVTLPSGKTETLPIYVQSQYAFDFNTSGAYAASVVLALIAVAMTMASPAAAQSGGDELVGVVAVDGGAGGAAGGAAVAAADQQFARAGS